MQGTNNGFYQGISINSVFVIVTDDDDAPPAVPVITISAGAAVTEGGNAEFTVTANPAPTANLDVSLIIDEAGGYVAAGDLGTGKTVTILANEATATYAVATIADSVDEINGSVTASLAAGSGYSVGSPAMDTVTVNDDDTRGITLVTVPATTAPDYALRVVENGGTATYTVVLDTEPTGTMTEPTGTVTVTPSSLNASVASVSDSLTFNTSNWDTPQTVTVTGGDNTDEAATVISHSVVGGDYEGLPTPPSVTVVIKDADTPVITIAAGESTAAEGGRAQFVVTASVAPPTDLTVNLSFSFAGDYRLSSPQSTVTIPGGTTMVRPAPLIAQNDIHQPSGTVTASLTARSGYIVGSPAMASVTVTDDEDRPTLTIAGPTLADAFLEGASGTTEMMEFDVTSSAASLYPVGCWTQQNAGTALAADFVARNTHTLPTSHLDFSNPSQLSRTFAVTVNGDDVDDGNKRIAVRCIFVGGDGYTANSLTTTGWITDDDTRGITFNPSSVTVAEDAGTKSYTVVLDSQPTADVTVTLGVTAVEGTGAVSLTSSVPLAFTTATWNTLQTVNLTITDDDMDNPGDRRTATITHTAAGGDYGGNNVAVDLAVTVTDDDEANEAPVFTEGENATRGLPENSGANVNVGAPVAATDAESDTLTYALSGTDAASFDINAATGQLLTRANVAYDFEMKSTYSVTMTVTATGGSDSITVTINLTDVNDAPVFTEGDTATREVLENSGANVNVGAPVTATDQDRPANTLSYTLSGTDAGSFNIVQATGQLTTKSGETYEFETKPSYSVTVSVNDGKVSNNTDTIAVTITLTDVVEAGNTAPTFTDGANTTRAIGNENVGPPPRRRRATWAPRSRRPTSTATP